MEERYYTAVPSILDTLAAHLAADHPVPPADGKMRAAVAAIVDADARVLLMRRTERVGDPWSGHVALPGGRYEPGDGDLFETAIRETREELDVDLRAARALGRLPALHPMSSGKHGIEVTPFAFGIDTAISPRLGSEAAAVFWLPLPLAGSGALDGSYEYPPAGMTFPCWSYDGFTIWGLTLRILSQLLDAGRA
jgi:8-oxo-dGTP pyrophosphatase MutT (NUDIX family)